MKKLLPIALLVAAVVAGALFLDQTPSAPVTAGILSVTNHDEETRLVTFALTNHTGRLYYFFGYPQVLSNGQWSTSLEDRNIFGGTRPLPALGEVHHYVGTLQATGLVRLQITYGQNYTPLQRRLLGLRKFVGLRPAGNLPPRHEFYTAPVPLPPR